MAVEVAGTVFLALPMVDSTYPVELQPKTIPQLLNVDRKGTSIKVCGTCKAPRAWASRWIAEVFANFSETILYQYGARYWSPKTQLPRRRRTWETNSESKGSYGKSVCAFQPCDRPPQSKRPAHCCRSLSLSTPSDLGLEPMFLPNWIFRS